MASTDLIWPHKDPIMAEKNLEYWFCEKIEKKIFFSKNENFQRVKTGWYRLIPSTKFLLKDALKFKDSYAIGFRVEASWSRLQINPFSTKTRFSAKIYGFSKNFFRSKYSKNNFTYDSIVWNSLLTLYSELAIPTKFNLSISTYRNVAFKFRKFWCPAKSGCFDKHDLWTIWFRSVNRIWRKSTNQKAAF